MIGYSHSSRVYVAQEVEFPSKQGIRTGHKRVNPSSVGCIGLHDRERAGTLQHFRGSPKPRAPRERKGDTREYAMAPGIKHNRVRDSP